MKERQLLDETGVHLSMTLIDILQDIENTGVLRDRLNDGPEGWDSLLIDYEEPVVERLWRELDVDGFKARLMLHRIHPCKKPLRHPHPWPSAVKILSGDYKMEVGHVLLHTFGQVFADPICVMRLGAGDYYEMTNPWSWHSVQPIGGPSLSIMLTMPPWTANTNIQHPKPKKELQKLTTIQKCVLLDDIIERVR